MLPELAPLVYPTRLPGLHRAGPSTPLDDKRKIFAVCEMLTWAQADVNRQRLPRCFSFA
jgi:hypothetical protein